MKTQKYKVGNYWMFNPNFLILKRLYTEQYTILNIKRSLKISLLKNGKKK